MPPRVPVRLAHSLQQPKFTLFSFLVPFLQHPQTRNASILSSLSDNPSAYNKKIRRGRGPSSGKGKTSGRGQKGQKARGKVPKNFNGGQTPESMAHGKMGFKNVHHVEMSELNLDTVQSWIDQGRLNPEKPITLKEIHKSNAVHGVKDGVKLLARGSTTLKTPIHIVVSRASQTAIEAVEKAGGSVTTRFYTPAAIRRIRQGLMHPYISLRWDPTAIGNATLLPVSGMTPAERVTGLGFLYRLPDPSSRKDIEYYRDAKNRGYLAHTVAQGESASLYWKPPISEEELRALKKNTKGMGEVRRREENKLW